MPLLSLLVRAERHTHNFCNYDIPTPFSKYTAWHKNFAVAYILTRKRFCVTIIQNDRGAFCQKYRTLLYEGCQAVRKRGRCRSVRCGGRMAGSAENIRPVVAFVRSAIIKTISL